MTDFEIEVFHDGACPLCAREVRMLRRRDRQARFDASQAGVSWEDLMARIHGRLPDGTIIDGPEVFRRMYAAVGFRRLVALSRWPGVAALVDLAYGVFAKNRLRLTGRCAAAGCALPAA